MSTLRKAVIHLASENPNLRTHLLPIIVAADREKFQRIKAEAIADMLRSPPSMSLAETTGSRLVKCLEKLGEPVPQALLDVVKEGQKSDFERGNVQPLWAPMQAALRKL